MNQTNDPPRVAVVTRASRGVGKGIALAFGAAGMTVYVTGRSSTKSLGRLNDIALPGTITETATQIVQLGGRGIAVHCDHRDDNAVRTLFDQVRREAGRIDILVNNAAAIHDSLIDQGGFWEKPLELADILDVGLRSGYVASYYAAPLLISAGRGLIAFTSSFGASCYMHGPAYGAQKQSRPGQFDEFIKQGETPEFNGRIIHALACDPEMIQYSGQTLITAELARHYEITEAGGRQPPSYREMLGSPRMPHPAKVM